MAPYLQNTVRAIWRNILGLMWAVWNYSIPSHSHRYVPWLRAIWHDSILILPQICPTTVSDLRWLYFQTLRKIHPTTVGNLGCIYFLSLHQILSTIVGDLKWIYCHIDLDSSHNLGWSRITLLDHIAPDQSCDCRLCGISLFPRVAQMCHTTVGDLGWLYLLKLLQICPTAVDDLRWLYFYIAQYPSHDCG